jgi:putative chitinase
MKRTTEEWTTILTDLGVKPGVVAIWAPVFADEVTEEKFNKGREELDDFLGQVLHESDHLEALSEDMNYSALRLTQVWPKRFSTLDDARPYANNPEALANRVYGGRMGNTQPGDGWKYRARTPIGLTGHDNYLWVGDKMGQDLVNMPELLEQPHYAIEAAMMWWEGTIPDSMIGDPEKETQRINGGLIGLADRQKLITEADEALG